MYQQHIKNIVTGETGVCVQRPSDNCPTIQIAPDNNPTQTVSWPKSECVVVFINRN